MSNGVSNESLWVGVGRNACLGAADATADTATGTPYSNRVSNLKRYLSVVRPSVRTSVLAQLSGVIAM